MGKLLTLLGFRRKQKVAKPWWQEQHEELTEQEQAETPEMWQPEELGEAKEEIVEAEAQEFEEPLVPVRRAPRRAPRRAVRRKVTKRKAARRKPARRRTVRRAKKTTRHKAGTVRKTKRRTTRRTPRTKRRTTRRRQR